MKGTRPGHEKRTASNMCPGIIDYNEIPRPHRQPTSAVRRRIVQTASVLMLVVLFELAAYFFQRHYYSADSADSRAPPSDHQQAPPSLSPPPQSLPAMLSTKARHGPISGWNATATKEFVSQLPFSSFASQAFASVEGKELTTMCKDCPSLSLSYDLQSPSDLAVWFDAHSAVGSDFSIGPSMGLGLGASDLDLWSLILHNPRSSRPFFALLFMHPHLALGVARLKYGEDIDAVMFGEARAQDRSPWSPTLYLLCPGVQTCLYAWSFHDTNPSLVLLLLFAFSFSDLCFWIEVCQFLLGARRAALFSFASRAVAAVCWAAATWVVFLYDNPVRNVVQERGVTNCAFFFWGMWGVVMSKRSGVEIYMVGKWLWTRKNVVEIEKMNRVKEALRRLKENEDREMLTDPKDLYQFGYELANGAGSFGRVSVVRCKATREKLAMKKFKVQSESEKRDIAERLREKAKWAALFFLAGGTNHSHFSNLDDIVAGLKLELAFNLVSNAEKSWRNELQGLHAVKALNHPSLQKLYTAHNTGNDNLYIVTQLVECGGLKDQPLSVRLSAVQTFFSAVAELHSAGIVHRDLKIDNCGVLADNPSRSVILDFGQAELPCNDIGEDCKMNECDPRYATPEQSTVLEHLSPVMLSIVHGYQGPPSDVWAAGITAIEMVLFGLPNCNDVETIYRLGRRTSRNNSLPKNWYRGPDSSGNGLVVFYEACLKDSMTPGCIQILLDVVKANWSELASREGGSGGGGGLGAAATTTPSVAAFCELIESMLNLDRRLRPTMKEVASSTFFQDNMIGDYGVSKRSATAVKVVGGNKRFSGKFPVEESISKGKNPRTMAIKTLEAVSAELFSSGKFTANVLTEDECGFLITELKKLFKEHSNRRGELKERDKLITVMRDSGLQNSLSLSFEDCCKLWHFFDYDDSGSISKLELFLGLTILLTPVAPMNVRLELLFLACDENDDGRISLQEMRDVLFLFDWTEEDVADHFSQLDQSMQGQISKETFLQGMKHVSFSSARGGGRGNDANTIGYSNFSDNYY